jgi:hypothetical protein
MADPLFPNFNPAGLSSLGFAKDWAKSSKYKLPADYGLSSGGTQSAQPSAYTLPPVSALPADYSDKIKAIVELETQLQPLYLQQAQAASKFGAEATRQQMIDQFPILSAASSQSKFLNEALSEKYAKFKEYLPTAQSVRNVAAQSQITSAAGAEAERDRATATQAMAAKEFARGYAGQTFRMA